MRIGYRATVTQQPPHSTTVHAVTLHTIRAEPRTVTPASAAPVSRTPCSQEACARFLRCRQESGPRATRARPSCLEPTPAAEPVRDQ